MSNKYAEFSKAGNAPTNPNERRKFRKGKKTFKEIKMREFGSLELISADEVQVVFGARAGTPVRNQQVDLRVLPITHPVHPGDLAPQKVEVAVVAVEEYTKRPIGLLWRRLYGRILRERE